MSQDIPIETLELRTKEPSLGPHYKKWLIVALLALTALVISVIVVSGLQPNQQPGFLDQPELQKFAAAQPPEEIKSLPQSYDQIPVLGQPLPGAFAKPFLSYEQTKGLQPKTNQEATLTSEQLTQARTSGVFFQLQSKASPQTLANNEHSPTHQPSLPPPSALHIPKGQIDRLQQHKIDFIGQAQDKTTYNPYTLQKPASKYQLMAGTIIPASLITGINSGLPGFVIAQVTENIYDTVSGRFVLIPQGSRLIGSYDSVISYGQSRALLVWSRIIMPDGSSVQIDNLPATDPQGYAGLEDQVDYHTWELLKGIALSTLLGVGTELSLSSSESDLVRALRQSTQQNAAQAGQHLTEKNLSIQPTLTIRPGWPVRVIVHKDIILKPYQGETT